MSPIDMEPLDVFTIAVIALFLVVSVFFIGRTIRLWASDKYQVNQETILNVLFWCIVIILSIAIFLYRYM